MRLSLYNSAVNINDKHTLLYNSFTGKFVAVRNRLIGLKDLSDGTLQAENESLYKQCVDAGIIIEDNTDEISLLKERIDNADNNEHEYILHINPTLDCNFRCWYCYEKHQEHSKMDEATLNSTLQFISSVLHRPSVESFSLGFFGGEPLLHFNSVAKRIISHTQSLCDELDKSLHIHFTSNGALLTDDMIAFLSRFSCGFQITLDGGKEAHDKTRFFKSSAGSYDIIVKNIHRLAQSGTDVIVRVNYTAENIDSVYSIFESFSALDEEYKKHIRFDFQRVWQDRSHRVDETENKIKDIRQKFRDAHFAVLANYIPHDVRNSCYGDKLNHALINYNGDVFGCTARDFIPENRIGYIDSDGRNIHYDPALISERNNSKFSKSVCKKCRIAPVCGGGCKQRSLESADSGECTFHYTEEDIDGIITDIFEHSFLHNS